MYLERSSTIQFGSSSRTDSREWLVKSPRTFAPAARPARIPAGASSTTRPIRSKLSPHINTRMIHTLCYINAGPLRSYQVRVGAVFHQFSHCSPLRQRERTHCGFPFCTSWAATKTLGSGIPTTLSASEAYSRVAEWEVSLRRAAGEAS